LPSVEQLHVPKFVVGTRVHPPEQCTPQPPQLVASLVTSTQRPRQQWSPPAPQLTPSGRRWLNWQWPLPSQ
jgi:hypothetical protein